MPLKIGTELVGGMKIGTEMVSGLKIGTETAFRSAPVDQPGTLTVNAVAGGRRNAGAVVTLFVFDPDGITSITSAVLNSSDGQGTRDFAATIARTDANTFTQPAMTFNNARWRTATVTITYVDGNGLSATLVANYTV